jgi:NAD(P)H-nitrite reductase large subunit
MNQDARIVIVGGGLAGWRTAEELRAAGFTGRVTLLTEETIPPYDRPSLSKRLLKAGVEAAPDLLAEPERTAESLNIDLQCGVRATALRPRTVLTDCGAALDYDALVIATGSRARELPTLAGHPHVHLLRTFSDAMNLRTAMDRSQSVLVIGAGFIGAEVATAARDRGLDVTIIEALAVPYERALGRLVGGIAGRMATRYGVTLLTGRQIESLDDDMESVTVTLKDGSRLSADIAVVGVGTRVNVEWLGSNAADAWDVGITCDAAGRVQDLHLTYGHVYAAGDVAAWYDQHHGRHARFEHWMTAAEQAPVVAQAVVSDLSGTPRTPAPQRIPYFWSDQFGRKVQLLGCPELADWVEILCGTEDSHDLQAPAPRRLVAGYFAGNALVAVAGVSAPALLVRYRQLIAQGASRSSTRAFTADMK